MMIIFYAVIILAIILLSNHFWESQVQKQKPAEVILKERNARDEISQEEYWNENNI